MKYENKKNEDKNYIKNIIAEELSAEELSKLDRYWRACNYLAAGMIYLQDNPMLKRPLSINDIKKRLLGHWGTSPGLSFIYVHLNRMIKKYNLNMIYIAGPGHGAPGVLGPVYLEGTYSEINPDISQDEDGLRKLFKHFSFPGGIGSHCTPEIPGSIHEGGELGYSLSHAYGAAFDNPDLIVTAVVGDGEAETGPLATAWHSNKFLNPKRDGAVLPILHLNGYKIANPTVLARISHQELEYLFKGYGYKPYFVEGEDPMTMHKKMAVVIEEAILEIRTIQDKARLQDIEERPMWPMIVLRSPKGWTGPKELDGHKLEGSWRSHQVPLSKVHTDGNQLKMLEDWLLSYKPNELFDTEGSLLPELKELAPIGEKRMSANKVANGGLLRKELNMPDFRQYAIEVKAPGVINYGNTLALGALLSGIFKDNSDNFRLFGPDETASNKLQAVYEVTDKTWLGDYMEEDADGGHLARDGRVMEMLSEHTLLGWLEGYLLTGRHGLFHTYEAFAHVIDSMFNQHAKWLNISKEDIPWRAPIASENILLSSTVWRQDHNGFSHQDPGFIDVVTNKNPDVVRIYLPPDANCLLAIANHCFKSVDLVNVIVADKQKHLQYLNIEEAIEHCSKGLSIWDWASNGSTEPDIVIACCGDVTTKEALGAAAILRKELPKVKVRFINIVDLFKLISAKEHPHGLSDEEFDKLFTKDKEIIFNFHGYPWLIHKLTNKRINQTRIHVHGYMEKGSINTPLELAIENKIDRYNLVIDVIDRLNNLGYEGTRLREKMLEDIQESLEFAHVYGMDKQEIIDWKWPY
jgi:xylulose-5-phosphate/fructose-6-phosphate phosphoketolase